VNSIQVLFVLPDLPLSGAATRTGRLAHDLVAGGDVVRVAVLHNKVSPSLARQMTVDGVEILVLTRRQDRARLRSGLLDGGPTVVHAAMPTAGGVGLMIARRHGLAFVYSVTNSLHIDRPFRTETPRDRLKVVLERLVIDHADAVHAVSHGVARQIAARHPAAIRRTHTVVHPPTEPPGTLASFSGYATAAPRLLCLGRLVDHKRVEDAIEAAALLRGVCPLVHLAVVGTGPRLPDLRLLVQKRDLCEHVTIVGESANPAAYFQWADILVHPSLYEGYPRAVAEALAHGVSVICSASAHAPAGSGIYYSRPLDPTDLANEILRAFQEAVRPAAYQPHEASSSLRALYRILSDSYAP
jgi:glycosyltransferase involved in cell wall biosynthesis